MSTYPTVGVTVSNTDTFLPSDPVTGEEFLVALDFANRKDTVDDISYCQIGDSAFHIPPTSITLNELSNNRSEDVLRTAGGIVMNNGFVERELTFEIMFTDTEAIFGLPKTYSDPTAARRISIPSSNGAGGLGWLGAPVQPSSLAALIAQFKRTPILPIRNKLVNFTFGVFTIALEGLTVMTHTDGQGRPIPNVMRVILRAKVFEHSSFCQTVARLSDAFIWPLQRWFWRQEYGERVPGETAVYVADSQNLDGSFNMFPKRPHETGMDGSFQFSTLSEDWIKAVDALRTEFNQRLQQSLTTQFRIDLTAAQQTAYQEQLAALLNQIKDLSEESTAKLNPVNLGSDVQLTQVTAQVVNNLTPLRVPDLETPAYQHMGQGDVRLVATFVVTSDDSMEMIRKMISDSRKLAREARFEVIAGFVSFENEVAALMGVHSVVFTDIQVQTIPNFPHTYIVAIEMLGFDRYQRRLESVQQAANTPLYYLDQNAVAFGPEETMGDVTDPRYIFWQRNLKTKTAKNSSVVPNSADPDNNSPQASLPGLDPTGRPINAWFNMAYIEQATEQIAALELYPDLQLPPWNRLKLALTIHEIFPIDVEQQAQLWMQEIRWQNWGAEGKYVDPDFYIDYPNRKLSEALGNPASSATQNMSALAQSIAAGEKQVAVNDLMFVDGSLSQKFYTALYDTYPKMGMYGPSINDNPANQSGDSGWPKGNTVCHANIGFPSPGQTTTATKTYSYTAPSFTEDVTVNGDHYTVTHPQDGNDPKLAPIADVLAFRKLMQASPTLGDSIQQTKDNIDKGELSQALLAHHPVDVGSSAADEHNRLLAICTDLIQHDASGRMIQCFPSYVFQLIDEGPRMSWYKIFPNFYALQAIQSIDVIQDRREPADTAVVEMMNTYGNLSSYTALQLAMAGWIALDRASLLGEPFIKQMVSNLTQDIKTASPQGVWGDVVTSYHMLTDSAEELLAPVMPSQTFIKNTVALRNRQAAALMIAPGVRLHIRIGYGANGGNLPIVFNGRITDVGYGERMRVVALGDGIELDNLIPGAESETNSINRPDRGWAQTGAGDLYQAFNDLGASPGFPNLAGAWDHIKKSFSMILEQTYEPRELICNLLNSCGEEMYDYGLGGKFFNWIKTNIRTASNGAWLSDNPMGISHFGNPYLFNYWDALSGKGLDTYGTTTVDGTPSPDGAVGGSVDPIDPSMDLTHQLASYAASIKAADQEPLSKIETIAAAGLNLATVALGASPAGPTGLGINTTLISKGMSNLQFALVGGASMFRHWIPGGYGETGENVYQIYTPFSKLCREAGSFFSNHGIAWMTDPTGLAVEAGLAAVKEQALGDLGIAGGEYPPLPDIGYTGLSGAHSPGSSLNMYCKNKTAWDVITTCAQYFPPYVAAVRPFEYRSTLFFGAPYFQYRYGYKRISAYELGQTDGSLDLFYGYPVAYKTKPFAQMRYYNSSINLLENEIRASDEDTYTDVVAMWYKGQGYSGERPSPKPTHQTVDRQIAPALRKTAIVNTDILGVDTAPSSSAVLGSFGGALIGYWAEHFIEIPGTDIGVHGMMNFFITEQNMRMMARALLRDYQRLMYQGRILVLGDPSARPFDHMYIQDNYTDITGQATIRRVIHHFGIETGFVSSIEPDLLCEVKGESFMTSMWTWIGILGTGIGVQIASDRLLSKGRLEFIKSLGRLGMKFASGNKKFGQYKVVAGKVTNYIKGMPTDDLLRIFRNTMLDSLYKATSLGKNSAQIDELASVIKIMLDNGGLSLGLGADTIDAATQANTQALILDILTRGISVSLNSGEQQLFDQAVIGNLTGPITADTLESIAQRIATQFIVTNGLWDFAKQSVTGVSINVIEKLGLSTWIAGITSKLAINAATKAGAAAVADIAGEFAATIATRFWGVAIGSRFGPEGIIIGAVVQLIIAALWTEGSRWWDDQTSLAMCPLTYRGLELSAGINGHSETIIVRASQDSDEPFAIGNEALKLLRDSGAVQLSVMAQNAIAYLTGKSNTFDPNATTPVNPATAGVPTATNAPLPPIVGGGVGQPSKNYSSAERLAIANYHGGQGKGGGFSNPAAQGDFIRNDGTGVCDKLVGLFDLLRTNQLRCDVSVFIAGHSHFVEDSNGQPTSTPSEHYTGQAGDIVYVNSEVAGYTLGPNFLKAINVALSYSQLHQVGISSAMDPSPVTGPGGWSAGTYFTVQGKGVFEDNNQPHVHLSVYP